MDRVHLFGWMVVSWASFVVGMMTGMMYERDRKENHV